MQNKILDISVFTITIVLGIILTAGIIKTNYLSRVLHEQFPNLFQHGDNQ